MYQAPSAGIGDAAERAFLLQHELGVAGDAAGERIGLAHGPGEGQHGDGVGAAERRAGAGGRRAQHVHPRIAPGHHALRRGGGDVELVDGVRGAARLGDAGGKLAGGAQLGDRQEQVGVGGKGQSDLREGRARPQARGFAGAQVGDEGRQHGAELLGLAAAGLVVGAAVGHERRHVGHGAAVVGELGGDLAGALRGVVERAGAGEHAERIVVEGAAAHVLVDVGRAPDLEQAAGGIHGVLARVERDGAGIEEHAFERCRRGPRRCPGEPGLAGGGHLQEDRRGAAREVVEDGGVGGLRVGLGVALADIPAAGEVGGAGGDACAGTRRCGCRGAGR